LVVALIWTLFCPQVGLQAAEDPERNWTIEKRGKIVLLYSPETEGLVGPTWNSLSRSFKLIEELLGWSLTQELTVVITDHADMSNGWASVVPYPDIHLLAFPPPLDSALAGPGSWWDRLILHELLHVMHLLRAGGVHDLLNRLLGPIDYPNTRLPDWFTEGLAVWVESQEALKGRLNHPRFLGRKRVTLLEQPPLTIDRLSTGPIAPPAGTAAYMFGGAFLSYVALEHGGARSLKAFVEKYGSDLLPYGLNRTLKHVSGVSFLSAYEGFMALELERAKKEAEGRGAEVDTGHRIVSERLSIRALNQRFGGRELVHLESDGHHKTQIVLRRVSDGARLGRQICVGGCGGGLSLSSNGRTAVVSTLSPIGPVRSSGDLYAYSVDSPSTPVRWSYDAHLARPDAHRYPEKPILAVRSMAGKSEIVGVDGPGEEARVVLNAREGVRVDMPMWSNTTDALVFVEMDAEHSRLVWMDSPDGERRILARSNWPLVHPVFSPDDQAVFVSAVVSGVYDVVEIRVETGSTLQWTQSLGGTAYPVPLGDDGIVFADMRGYGWSVQRMNTRVPHGPVELRHLSFEDHVVSDTPTQEKADPPSLLSLARPHAVFPIFQYASGQSVHAGLVLSGSDPLPHHSWSLFVQGVAANEGLYRRPDWGGSYLYGGFPIDLTLNWHDIYRRRFGFDGSAYHGADGRSRRMDVGAWVDERGLESRDVMGISLGLHYGSGDSPFKRPDPGGRIPSWVEDELRPSLGLYFRHYGRRSVRYGTVPHYGYSLGTSVHYEPSLSDERSERWRLNWFFVAPMTFSHKHHVVLTHRLHGRLSFAPRLSREVFRLGGLESGNLIFDYLDDVTSGYESLRGFSPGRFKGHHVQRWTLDLSIRAWDILRGVGTWPLALRRITPALFADFGWIGPFRRDTQDLHAGAGMELRIETEIGFGIRPLLRAGFGRGFGPDGISQAYIVWGSSP
jgi:hypothetical protein